MIDDYLRGETFYSGFFIRYITTIQGKMKNYYNKKKSSSLGVGVYYLNIFVHIIVVILSDNLQTDTYMWHGGYWDDLYVEIISNKNFTIRYQ